MLCCLAAGLISCPHLSAQDVSWYKAPAEREVRRNMDDWQQYKFGMFVHWGTYSELGTVESWSICPEDKSWQYNPRERLGLDYMDYVKMYENLKCIFNPKQYDPEKWAAAARRAGMKYVVFTTKHHDGFCMFDTKQTDYKVTDEACPYHTNPNADIAKALFEAFRAEGIKTGAYLSVADWHNDGYWWRRYSPKDRYLNYDPQKYPEKYKEFVDMLDSQVDELTGGDYGRLEMLWLDLCEISETYRIDYPWERIAATARANQPDIMTVARGTHGIYENYYTSEQKMPDHVLDIPWEACYSMAAGWSYNPNPRYKSTLELLTLLVQTVSRGGNLLLNVGPGPNGTLDAEAYDRLESIGEWMDINSEGIYGTQPVAPYQQDNIYYTAKENCIYAFYIGDSSGLELPAELKLTNLPAAASVSILGNRSKLPFSNTADGIGIRIPSRIRSNLPCKDICCFRIELR